MAISSVRRVKDRSCLAHYLSLSPRRKTGGERTAGQREEATNATRAEALTSSRMRPGKATNATANLTVLREVRLRTWRSTLNTNGTQAPTNGIVDHVPARASATFASGG